MKKITLILLTISFCGLTACKTGTKKGGDMDKETLVKIETTAGDIKVKLYNETPKHRDNFIKLVKDGVYEGTLFHRVIKDFMIQAGDPDSKNAPKGKMLGAGDVGYTVPAEFVYPKYFHKKGALSAARQGDNVNPKKESSGCQFYIVTGKVYNDSTLLGMESQMNENKIQKLLADISSVSCTRELDARGDLAQFGLEEPANTIQISLSDGTEKDLYIGDKNTSTHELYFQTEEKSDKVYMTKTAFDSDFAGKLQDFAAYTDFPKVKPETMTEFDVDKEEDSYVLIMTGDDQCTVEDEEGESQLANLNLVGMVQDNVSNIIWYQDLEYNCSDYVKYGLDDPQMVLTVKYKDGEEAKEFELSVGDEDENGNYYARLNELPEIHTIRGEYLTDLLKSSAASYWSLTYSFVSIGDLDKLEVTRDGATHVLRKETQTTKGGLESVKWLVDEQEVDEKLFTDFYYACVSVTAQERLESVPEETGDEALKLVYTLTDGSKKEITYYEEDQNFYTVIYEDGTKAAHTNKLYVKTMTEKLDRLLEELK